MRSTDLQLLDDVLQQIVGHRSRRDDPLQRERYRGGFNGPDPYREETLPFSFAEEDDGLVRRQFDAHADQLKLDDAVTLHRGA
jgi:hypothetical protein